MRTYSYLFFVGGRLDHQEIYPALNDANAVALADLLSFESDIEIWDTDRLVARVEWKEERLRAA